MASSGGADSAAGIALDAEDAKLLTLARGAWGRGGGTEGAAVRDTEGRTYAAADVRLPSLRLSALEAAVAAAVSSGAKALEAAVVVAADPAAEPAGVAAVRDLTPGAPVHVAGRDAIVVRTLD